MSTKSQESIIDVQKLISRSFKNNGECCISCQLMQQGQGRAHGCGRDIVRTVLASQYQPDARNKET